MTHENFPAGTIIDGRYRVEGRLGRGGFATVYKAEHLQLGRYAALKVLEPVAPHITERFQARFNTEARIAANLDHPHVVRIFDFGFIPPDDRPYMAMELLDGRDLEQFLEENDSMDPARAKRLFLPVLDVLRIGHERGIVHKDLKPSNLFIVKEGTPDEKLVVLDYGIARLEGEDNPRYTEEGTYTGTPAYMPPEYIHRREVTPAYDVYQIGLIFIEAMTGQPVVKAGSQIAYMVAHVEGKHHVPDGFGDTPLGQTLLKAIAVEPADRYPNAGEMLSAVETAEVVSGTDFTMEAITLDDHEVQQITGPGLAENTTQREAEPKPNPTPKKGMSAGRIFAILAGIGCLATGFVVALSVILVVWAGNASMEAADGWSDDYDNLVQDYEALVEDYDEAATAIQKFEPPKIPTMPNIGQYPTEGQEMFAWLLSRHMVLVTLHQVAIYEKTLRASGGWTKKGASFVPAGTADLLSTAEQQMAIGMKQPPKRTKLEKEASKMQPVLLEFNETLSALYDYHSVTRGWESDGGAHGKMLTKRLKDVTARLQPMFKAWSKQIDGALETHLRHQEDKLSKDPFLLAATRAMQAEQALITTVMAGPITAKANRALSKYDKALKALQKQISANRAALTERYQITMGLHDRYLGSLKDTRKQVAEIQAEARDGDSVASDLGFLSMQLHSTFDVYNQLQRF